VAEQKQEQKLGAVTYLDPDKSEAPVSMQGITFVPGEAVNIDELISDKVQADRLKQKLAGNPYFRVEGGPDHAKTTEERQKHEADADKKRQQLTEKKDQRAQQQAQAKVEANRPAQPTLEHGSEASRRK
jgi:hypothetical protein